VSEVELLIQIVPIVGFADVATMELSLTVTMLLTQVVELHTFSARTK
jgi:hypothetical protein